MRLARLLERIKGRIRLKALDRVSPFAAPVLMEIGREPVLGAVEEVILRENAADLAEEAMRL